MDLWSGVMNLGIALSTGSPSASTVEKIDVVKNLKAKNTLIFAVADSEFVHLQEDTAFECWNNLKAVYATPGKVAIAKAYETLFSVKLKDGDDIVAHLTDQLQQAQRLKQMGETVSDPVLVSALLSSLPPSYQDLRLVLENLSANDFTSANIGRRIRAEVATRPKPVVKKESSLLAVDEAKAKKSKAHIRCHECGLMGHYRGSAECELTTGRNRRGGGGGGGAAARVV
ncbi:hypothetical protein P7C70_g7196, partial [Phenoliferia sp. Uapishka_3]